VKDKVYNPPLPTTVDDLRKRIREVIAMLSLTPYVPLLGRD
jgi:hypothetical protein